MLDVTEQGSYVLLAGSFNPAIFNPDWLHSQGIFSTVEIEDAEVEVIQPDIAKFTVGNVLFDVRAEQAVVLSQAEPFVRLRDVVGQLFSERLKHTPLTGANITYFVHADLHDWQQRVRFGRKLAPLDGWGPLHKNFEREEKNKVGGLVDLTMQFVRDDAYEGFTRVTVQPSHRVEGHSGVFIQVSEHFAPVEAVDRNKAIGRSARRFHERQAKKGKIVPRTDDDEVVDYAAICVAEYAPSISRSRGIVEQLLSVAEDS